MKADNTTEAGQLPRTEMLAEMNRFNEWTKPAWMASMDSLADNHHSTDRRRRRFRRLARGHVDAGNEGRSPGPVHLLRCLSFAGDKIAELTAFVIRTDKPRADNQTPNESRQTAGSRVN